MCPTEEDKTPVVEEICTSLYCSKSSNKILHYKYYIKTYSKYSIVHKMYLQYQKLNDSLCSRMSIISVILLYGFGLL